MLTTIFVFVCMAFLFTYAYASYKGAPWVPMRRRDFFRIDTFVPLHKTDVVYDLGSGDGRVLVHAIDRGVARVVGYELSLLPYIISWFRTRKMSRTQAHVFFRDFWKQDISDASVVFIFLSPEIHRTIGKKFVKELKKGTRIVAYVWPVPQLRLVHHDKTKDAVSLFVYEV